MSLEPFLDKFKSKYAHIEIRPKHLDVTECFRNATGELMAPENHGDLEQNVVMLYVVRGAPFIKKYGKDTRQELTRVQLDSDGKILSCLCLRDLQNTSFQEIRKALELGMDEVQGYRRCQVRNIRSEEHT